MGLQLGMAVGLNDGSTVRLPDGSAVTGFADGCFEGLGVTGDVVGDCED